MVPLVRGPRLALALLVLALACGSVYALAVQPAPRDKPLDMAPRDHVRVVLVGDTGLSNDAMDAVRAAIMAEKKDLIVALGDLAYPEAPPCPSGRLTPTALKVMDASVGSTLLGLGAPVLLLLGNHDVRHGSRDPAREACVLHYAASKPGLVMPALSWVVDTGVLSIVGLNTNALDDAQGRLASRAIQSAKGWTMFAGHHVLKTYHDKEAENVVRPWLKKHGLKPDIFANGHAHLLQFGVYDGVVAVTSGATALPRNRPACPPDCQPGQRFGSSKPGYAVLDVKAERVEISFHDAKGMTLFSETHRKAGRPASSPEQVK